MKKTSANRYAINRPEVRQDFNIEGKTDEQLTLKDCFQKVFLDGKRNGVFPTFILCRHCRGPIAFSIHGRVICRKDLAAQLMLLQHATIYFANSDNPLPILDCNCDEWKLKLRAEVQNLPPRAEDSWEEILSNSRRGITDYSKKVSFTWALTPDQVKLFCQYLDWFDSPGNSPVRVKKSSDTESEYTFYTTLDSSD
jgi:hypothetical protein